MISKERFAGRLRRRWSDDFEAERVARSLEAGADVSAIACGIGIFPQQLFGWRAEAIKGGKVERRDEVAVPAPTSPAASMIEIEINTVIRMDIDIGEHHLRRVIRAERSA
ncbi:transposase [Pelagibacterium sp. H642]|uniref:transposase n=1 Tax=Pelagibacterium sp. H642 TaxID=1881069 RepID=UPI0035BFA87A